MTIVVRIIAIVTEEKQCAECEQFQALRKKRKRNTKRKKINVNRHTTQQRNLYDDFIYKFKNCASRSILKSSSQVALVVRFRYWFFLALFVVYVCVLD